MVTCQLAAQIGGSGWMPGTLFDIGKSGPTQPIAEIAALASNPIGSRAMALMKCGVLSRRDDQVTRTAWPAIKMGRASAMRVVGTRCDTNSKGALLCPTASSRMMYQPSLQRKIQNSASIAEHHLEHGNPPADSLNLSENAGSHHLDQILEGVENRRWLRRTHSAIRSGNLACVSR